MGALILEYLGWFFLSILKFVITPSTMIGLGYSWLGTLITVSASAIIGFVGFYFFGEIIFDYFAKHRKKPAKKFTFMNRTIVKMKLKYGLLGMGIIAGVISVPLAGLLASRYFRNHNTAIPAISLAFFLWTLVLTSLTWVIKYVFHGHI